MRKTLSVVLATFNEEKNLPSCLDSLKDIADEIVIVDGTSTDRTVEIAKKYKAIIKVTTNKPNFHINKQMAIDMATKDWILQMDADEQVGEELKKEIKKILENDPKEFNGYWMPRKNWFLGRFLMKGGQYPDYTLRLYRKGKGRLPQKDVHEQAEVVGKVGYLKSALLHYPYSNFKHYIRKWDFYNNIFATQIRDEQKNKNILEKLFFAVMYLFVRPAHWLLTTFIRHKGFVDLWQGFTFSLFSALRFPVSYIKYVGIYKFLFISIVFVSAIIRFYNFPERLGFGGDDTRDVLIALEAIKRHELPLTGSFSSAGPFVFGGIFYWFIMLSYIILPFLISAPWIFMGAVSVLTVSLLMYMGKLVGGNKMSIVIGLLAITSPQLVVRSLTLGQHTFIATLSTLVIIFILLLWDKKKIAFALLAGFFIGLAFSFHYQAINLLIFIPSVFFIPSLNFKQRLVSFFLIIFGFLIPNLPILYWDYHQGFANMLNLVDYFLVAQYRIYVPNSWNLFIFNFVPTYWGFVLGNFSFVGLFLLFFSAITCLYLLLKKSLPSKYIFLGLSFFILLFLNRFYRGERSEGYLLYFLPFIFIFTAFLLTTLFEFRNKILKTIAVLLVILITVFNILYLINVLSYKSPYFSINQIAKSLYMKYPDTKFSIYDYKYKMYTGSTALSLIMSFDNKLDLNGKKIGISCYGKGCPSGLRIIHNSFPIVDLKYVNESDLDKEKKIWINVNQDSVFEDLIGWLNKHQLKSTFTLQGYTESIIGL